MIIVDDCSTDSSSAIVESYRERFGGRLTLSHMDKNSGGCALPRNKGLLLSRGEYVFSMDADDLFTPTALEELYTLAKKFDADVVHSERFFEANDDLSEVCIRGEDDNNLATDELTLETENLSERVQFLSDGKYRWQTWLKLVRRRLLIEHEIFFPHCAPCEDYIWTCVLIFYAKKILRVPNTIYIYRQSNGSVMRTDKTPQQLMNFWIDPILSGLESLEKMLRRHEFFRQNSQCLYQILELCIKWLMTVPVFHASLPLQPFEVYETIKKEFGDRLSTHGVLISALCSYINTLQREQLKSDRKFKQFVAAANNRIAELEAELQRLKS